MRPVVGLLSAVLLGLAACGDDDSTSISTDEEQPAGGLSPAQLSASCGAVQFTTIPADPSGFEGADAIVREVDRSELGMEAGFLDRYVWSIAAGSQHEVTLFGEPIEPIVEHMEYGAAHFRRDGSRWVPDSWGECRIELTAAGYGAARFVLDPDDQPSPTDTEIAVVAHEWACASGRSPGGRAVESIVVAEDEESVSIVVLVESPQGDQDCRGNPPIHLEVTLGSAIGDRTIYDGGVQPALARPWPPTELSLTTQGASE